MIILGMVQWMVTVLEIKTATKFLKLKSPIFVKNLGRTNRQTDIESQILSAPELKKNLHPLRFI